jgi:hypothetical protein
VNWSLASSVILQSFSKGTHRWSAYAKSLDLNFEHPLTNVDLRTFWYFEFVDWSLASSAILQSFGEGM